MATKPYTIFGDIITQPSSDTVNYGTGLINGINLTTLQQNVNLLIPASPPNLSALTLTLSDNLYSAKQSNTGTIINNIIKLSK